MEGKRILGLGLLLALVSFSFFIGQGSLQAESSSPVAFTHGVASGDVRPFSAVLWTRVRRSRNRCYSGSVPPQ